MFDYSPEDGTMRMYGIVGDDEINAVTFQDALGEMGGQDISIRLQSEGGSVADGHSMANAIHDYPGKVTVTGDAIVASIATVFPMAADSFQIYSNTSFMIHRAWAVAAGNTHELSLTAGILDKLDGDISRAYARKTGREADYWLDLMDKETWFDADTALELGLVDGIIDAEPQGAQNRHKPTPVATMGDCDAAARMIKEIAGETVQPRPLLAKLSTILKRQEMKLRAAGIR